MLNEPFPVWNGCPYADDVDAYWSTPKLPPPRTDYRSCMFSVDDLGNRAAYCQQYGLAMCLDYEPVPDQTHKSFVWNVKAGINIAKNAGRHAPIGVYGQPCDYSLPLGEGGVGWQFPPPPPAHIPGDTGVVYDVDISRMIDYYAPVCYYYNATTLTAWLASVTKTIERLRLISGTKPIMAVLNAMEALGGPDMGGEQPYDVCVQMLQGVVPLADGAIWFGNFHGNPYPGTLNPPHIPGWKAASDFVIGTRW